MLFSSKIFTLLVAAIAASAAPESSLLSRLATREAEIPSLNPPVSVVQDVPEVGRRDLQTPNPPRKHTNAERFAHGLPPVSPRKLWSRTKSARSGSPSQAPATTLHYRIRTTRVDKGVGEQGDAWVKNGMNVFGEFGETTDETEALHISITIPSDVVDGVASQLNVEIENTGYSFPYLSFVTGFANTSPDFGPGSFNYAYLANSGATPPGSPPANQPNSFTAATGIDEPVESAVWTYNTETKALYPQWINTDGSAPATILVYYQPDNVYIVTGDYGAFAANFGVDNSPRVAFTLEAVQLPA